VFGDDAQVMAVAGSTRDITERVRQDRQKDEFVGIVSHELKTPVTSIKAYAQVLRKRLAKEGNTGAVAHLTKMEAQINKLIALIGDLLDVTKINSGQLQFHEASFAFDEVVAEVIEEVQRTTERHTIISEGATHQSIYGDRDRVGQVLINLLTNAIKYSPKAATILVTSAANDDAITLSVQDFGIGISTEHLPHVFERFNRAAEEDHETVPGLGLGLYVSSEIIRRHGGSMWVESEKDQGSTFSFSLPIQRDQGSGQQHNTLPNEDVTHA
jgi:signal transduction histidine kinase